MVGWGWGVRSLGVESVMDTLATRRVCGVGLG